MEKKSRFGAAVGVHLAKLHSSKFDGCRSHPWGEEGSQSRRFQMLKLSTSAEPSKVYQKYTTGRLPRRLYHWLIGRKKESDLSRRVLRLSNGSKTC